MDASAVDASMSGPPKAKPTAASRTVDMFAEPKPIDQREVEVLDDEAREERVTMEEDVDRVREVAFKGQEWVTAAFGAPDSKGNEYRVTHRGHLYYVEALLKTTSSGATSGAVTAYGHTGVMVHERDLFALVSVLVQAVREKQKRDANGTSEK